MSHKTAKKNRRRARQRHGQRRGRPKFRIVQDPADPQRRCVAAELMGRLVSEGGCSAWQPGVVRLDLENRISDCHEVCVAIVEDLYRNGLEAGWYLATGTVDHFRGPHSWLEYQDWVFEAAAGLYLFWPIEQYRQMAHPRDVVRCDAIEVQTWLDQGAPLPD